EGREGHELDVLRIGQLLADEPYRADPLLVGAADAVAVVVGVVDADLQTRGDEQGEQREPELGPLLLQADVAVGRRGGGTDDDGGDRCGEGSRAGAGDPLLHGGHEGRSYEAGPSASRRATASRSGFPES